MVVADEAAPAAMSVADSEASRNGRILLTKANFFQKVWVYWTNFVAPAVCPLSAVVTKMLNEEPPKYAIAASILMNGAGQMRRSSADCYFHLIMGGKVTETEVIQIIHQPKNAFSPAEHFLPPHLVDPTLRRPSLFGDSEDEDEEQGA